MGINNRQRRASKARQRARQRKDRAGRGWQQQWDQHDDPEPHARRGLDRIRALLDTALYTDHDAATVAAAASALTDSDGAIVDREAEGAILRLVVQLWEQGWQPSELVRLARRREARVGRLVALAVAADHSLRDPATLHPRWASQIQALELPKVESATGWTSTFRRSEWLDRASLLGVVITAIGVLGRAGPLGVIIPPPGASTARSSPVTAAAVDDPVLVRVRALLAQAESTTFEAEAEAFTAKAQELMARHAIDAALLWAASERDERPTTIRLPIDDPYADIKSLLLQYVAQRSRCRAVYDDAHGLSTVVGFASDVAATELLFTSLLVQSQSALRAEGAAAGPGSRARSRGFRASFLMAFARRIDQRLAEINAAVEQAVDGEHQGSLLPVLASRHEAVDGAVDELFGTLRCSSVRGGSDAAGWVRGTMAADLAKLNAGDLHGRASPVEHGAPMLASG